MERSIGRPMSIDRNLSKQHRPSLTNRDIQREIPTSNSPSSYNNNNNNSNTQAPSNTSQQHEALINFIHDNWNKVTSETDQTDFYRSNTDRLQGFKPFDLEGWWGRRVVQTLNISRGNP